LQFVTDRAVDIVDSYRLGRFDAGKTRPILVKLRVIWDKRLILSRSNRLKGYSQRGIFIAPDQPLEARRKQTLERLKYRAQQQGKVVNVTDGVLFVDGVAEFSLENGFINNVRNG
jgi:hypothetical protein